MRSLMTLVRSWFGAGTPEAVKSKVTDRLHSQSKRLVDINRIVADRIREDYRRQDERMAGRR